ncbi:hypothetical protein QLY56_08310 [Cronobacter sakazakii]|nr:hypothetical protein [Cronobacter sakazakii]
MRLSRLPGYGLPELAFWPQPHYDNNKWWMHCLKLREDGSLHWHRRYVERDKPNVIYADDYVDYPTAKAAAIELNQNVTFDVDSLDIPDSHKESLRLKIEKALTAKSRLMDEEYLMYQVAIQKHANSPRPTLEELVLDEHFDSVAQELLEVLNEMSYLQCVNIPTYGIILLRDSNNVWKRTHRTSKGAKICYQERIARAFGLSGADHWGKTKSAIRSMLLPRANELLQLASVKRMLDDARGKGQKVLIAGSYVFWYEDKNQVGWCVKEANDSEITSRGNALWKEGTIISKNHGRIVVLPYIKENGEKVKGYTKNAPNDGKALPRHKDEYVELPFEVLDGDLMVGLFGELHYE